MLEAKKLQKLLLLNSSHNNKPKGEEKIQTEKGSNLERLKIGERLSLFIQSNK